MNKLSEHKYQLRNYRSENNINLRDKQLTYIEKIPSQIIIDQRVLIGVSQLGFKPEYVKEVIQNSKLNFSDEPLELKIAQIYDECYKNKSVDISNQSLFENVQEYQIEEESTYLEKLLFAMNNNWFETQQIQQNTEKIVQEIEQDVGLQVKPLDIDIPRKQNYILKGPKLFVQRSQKIQDVVDFIFKLKNIKFSEPVEIEALIQTEYCQICFSNINQQDVFAVAPCGHRFCKQCNLSYMENCIKTANVMRVNCPMEKCTEEYTEQIIEENVSIAMWQKFKKFKQKKIISLDTNVRWCPKIDCELYVVGSMFTKNLTCRCGQEICFDCGNQSHPDLTCENALDQFYRLAKQEYAIHPCPTCKAPIQKSSGCNHMTCYQCQYEFCWICMGHYTKIHYTVWNFCGCIVPGGQFYQTLPWKNVLFWKLMMVLPKLIGIFLLLIILLVLIPIPLMLQTLKFPYKLYRDYLKPKLIKNKFCVCNRCVEFLLFLPIGLIFFPISLTIQIVPLSCIKFWKYLRRRFQ